MKAAYLKSIIIILLLVCTNKITKADTQDNDSLKNNYITLLSQQWGFLTFYTPISDKQPKEWMMFLSESIYVLDTTNDLESSFKDLSGQMINKCKPFLSNSKREITNKEQYVLYYKSLFDWMKNLIYKDSELSFFAELKNYPQPPKEGYLPINILDSEKKKRDPFRGQLAITNKYDALANAVVYWNISAYYSPFPIYKKENWASVLKEYIPVFLNNNNNKYAYRNSIRNLSLETEDSHTFGYSSPWSKYLNIDKINDTVIIRGITDEVSLKYNLYIGDKIIRKDGKPLDTIFCFGIPYIFKGSHSLVSIKQANNFLLYSADSITKLELIDTNGNSKQIILFNNEAKLGKYKKTYLDNIPITKLINDSIPYINIGLCNGRQFAKFLKQNKNANYLLIDFRNYPRHKPINRKVLKYLVTNKNYFEKRYVNALNLPGYFKKYRQYPYYFTFKPILFNKNIRFAINYQRNKKIYLLADEKTQSQGEYLLQKVKSACNGIIVGRNSAGVNSLAKKVKLSDNIIISLSVNFVYDKNERLVSGNGIEPDVYVNKDINLVKQGKDEIIEKAIEIIKKEQIKK